MIHIYCGDGKGKTTASIGLAVRCDALFYGRVRTGYDMRGGDFVFVVQTRCIQ